MKKSVFCTFLIALFFFTVTVSGQSKKWSAGGSLTAQMKYYSSTGNAAGSRPPFVANINAQPEIRYGKWQIQSKFIIGNYQTAYRDFNRYSISPKYKSMRFYLGHSTLQWSPFVLESRPVLGAGFEGNPGRLRFGIYAGSINRASVRDTFRNRVFIPAFARRMISGRIGIGNTENYADIIVLKATDITNSLSSAAAAGLAPAENGIVALKLTKSLHKYWKFGADYAISAYTRNKTLTGSELSAPAISRVPSAWIKTNVSTQFLTASMAELKYTNFKSQLFGKRTGAINGNLQYARIDPGYQSMALYFLLSDVERIKAAISRTSPNQKYQVNGSFGFERNNILNTQFAGSKRIISGAGFQYRNGTALNLFLNLQNYAIKLLTDGFSSNDSLLLNQVNRNVNAGANLLLRKDEKDVNKRPGIQISAGWQSGKNIVPSTAGRLISHTYFTIKYSAANLPGVWRFSPGFGLHRFSSFGIFTTRHIPSVCIDRYSPDNRWIWHAESGLMLTWFNKVFNTFSWRNLFSGIYNVNKKSYFQTSVFIQPNLQNGFNFTEIQADLRYAIRF